MVNTAFELIGEGFGALPLNNDKSPKLPVGHNFLYELIKDDDIDKYFITADKIGIACGEVSDGFECIDFDGHNNEPIRNIFNDFMKDDGVKTITELHSLPIVKTPSGGYHIYYKCEANEKGQTLSKWKSGSVMIETRGNGQYAATIPSKGYTHLLGSDIIKMATISLDERDYLLSVAESFSQYINTTLSNSGKGKWPKKFDTTTAWGKFNEYGEDETKDLLIEAGWEFVRTRKHDNVGMWMRPGKEYKNPNSKPVSATFGKLHNMFYVFTDSVNEFDKDMGYTFFDILMRYKFNGDKVNTIKYLEQKYGIIHYKPTVRKTTTNFPINVFPDKIKAYIKEQNQISNFDVNLMCSTYLWLGSTIIGNRFTTFVNDNWNVSPVTWLMIIAERGSTKTHAINAIIKPAKKVDGDNRKVFEKAMKEYNPEDKEAIKPFWKQIFLEDGTREGFVKAISINGAGMGLMKDELNGWIADMDRHNGTKGGDEAFWLSSFNNSSYTKNIKGDDIPSYVNRMFINLAGSIQPDVVSEISRNHTVNGLFDRFLLVPYKEGEFVFKIKQPKVSHFDFYNEFVNTAIHVFNSFDAKGEPMYFTPEAETQFETAYNWLLQTKYKDPNVAIASYIAKLITYLPRIATVIELMQQAYNIYEGHQESVFTGISKDSVTKALDILKYFLNNARNVLMDMDEKSNLNDVIKDSGAVKKADKIKAAIKAMHHKDINMSIADIARELGVSKQLVKFHDNKVKQKNEASVDSQ